jgi:hypothetical protein
MLSTIIEAKPASNADLICVKPFDFIKNLVKELVADEKIELLCQLGKDLEGLVNEIKSEEDDRNLKLALGFWKESTGRLQNFECHLPKLIPSKPPKSTENKDEGN